MVKVNHSAKETNLSFYYQTLVGLDKCFELKEGESIYFEKDGDVSFIDKNGLNSANIEVKHYSDNLTDNHENFWKTLKNWLSPNFQHHQYRFLILHTAQPYGEKALLKDWNNQSDENRFVILQNIVSKRENDKRTKKTSSISQYQQQVMSDEDNLKSIIPKIIINVEMENREDLIDKICRERLNLIREEYRLSYLSDLVGFVYKNSYNSNDWSICFDDFNAEKFQLTERYAKILSFPKFSNNEAGDEQIVEYQQHLFVRKIKDIDYDEILPEAIGNYIEFLNALNIKMKDRPTYINYTTGYRNSLVSNLCTHYRMAKREKIHSQTFYDKTMVESPFSHQGTVPDLVYKNGLIQEIMNDTELKRGDTKIDLKWDTKQ